MGCHFLLQGIFPAQGSNPGLLHCRHILYRLSYQGSIAKAHITTSVLYVTEPTDGHLDCFHFFDYCELYCYEHAHTSLCVCLFSFLFDMYQGEEVLGFLCNFFFFSIFIFIYLAAPGLRCGMQTLSCGMWDLVPRPGIEPQSPALGAQGLSFWTRVKI